MSSSSAYSIINFPDPACPSYFFPSCSVLFLCETHAYMCACSSVSFSVNCVLLYQNHFSAFPHLLLFAYFQPSRFMLVQRCMSYCFCWHKTPFTQNQYEALLKEIMCWGVGIVFHKILFAKKCCFICAAQTFQSRSNSVNSFGQNRQKHIKFYDAWSKWPYNQISVFPVGLVDKCRCCPCREVAVVLFSFPVW